MAKSENVDMKLITDILKRKKKGPGLWRQSRSPLRRAFLHLVIPVFAAGCNVLPTVGRSRTQNGKIPRGHFALKRFLSASARLKRISDRSNAINHS